MANFPAPKPEALPQLCAHCGLEHSNDVTCETAVVAERYLLVRKLGEGGMGRVFEVRHLHLRRRLAMKLLHPHWAADPFVVSRFQHEAIAAGALDNEHIASATDFGFSERHGHYLVLEYVDGTTLREIIDRDGPLPVPRALALFHQVCSGLDGAHANGIVHRDIKPDNLSVVRRTDGSEHVKILDFGIAKLATSTQRTSAGTRMGTLYYMPPEQIRGEVDLDARADVYSVGVSLFESLTAELPHPGNTEPEVLLHIVTSPPQSLKVLRPDLPSELCEVVHRAIQSAAADRYQSILEFAAALQRCECAAAAPIQPRGSECAIPETSAFAPTASATAFATRVVDAEQPSGRAAALTTSTHPTSRSIPVPKPRHFSKRAMVLSGLLMAAGSLSIGVWEHTRTPSVPGSAAQSATAIQAGQAHALEVESAAAPSLAAGEPSAPLVVPTTVLAPSSTASDGSLGSSRPTRSHASPLQPATNSSAERNGTHQPAQPSPQARPKSPRARSGQNGAVFFDE